MRSRLCFSYPGIPGCLLMHVEILLVEVFMKVMNGLVMTLEEDKRFLCVWLLYYEQFCRFANEGAKISIKSFRLHEIILFCLMYSAAVKCKPKLLPFGKKCWLMLAGLGKKKRGNCEANLLYVESDFATTDTTDKSFTVSASWVR